MITLRRTAVALISASLLAACGSGSEDTVETAPVADTASASQVAETPPAEEPVATVEIANPERSARPDTVLSFTLNELGTEEPVHAASLPSQLVDDDADGSPDRLVFLTDLSPAEETTVEIVPGAPESIPPRTQAELSIKSGGEWVDGKYVGGTFENVDYAENPAPQTDHQEYFRYEGPGIESGHVGYRVYLDHRNGFDIFGKKTPDLVLQDVGQDGYDSYHEMEDWGADILKVGSSLGAGAYGYWNGESVDLVSDVAGLSSRILSSGPLHSSLMISHDDWTSSAGTVDLDATLSMTAGSPYVDVALETSEPIDNIAIGLVKHPETELLSGTLDVTGEAWSYIASFGQQTLFDDHLGMVILFKKMDLVEQTEDENNYVLVMRPRGTELEYAFGAYWEGGVDGIATKEDLVEAIEAEVKRRTVPARVTLKTANSDDLEEKSGLAISEELARSEIERRGNGLSLGEWDSVRRRPAGWTYTTGLMMEAMSDVAEATGDVLFADYAKKTMDSYIGDDGEIADYSPEEFNIDHINPGKIVQRLYAETGEEKYRKAIDALAAQLEDHPRTSEGAFWHKQRYPHQLWLDGVYMGMPFLAGVGVMEGDSSKIEAAVHEFEIARDELRDPETGLYYHAWDEAKQQVWADPETGRSAYVWGRGLGWYAMALVDILDVIPEEDTEKRQRLVDISQELAETLVAYQDQESGVWYQIVDMHDEPGNYLEASGSAMFTYFLAKGVTDGHLDPSYRQVAMRAYGGLVDEFVTRHADGSLHYNNICEVAGLGYGRDGSYDYYMSERVTSNDPKGLGPMIKAGVQVAKLSN